MPDLWEEAAAMLDATPYRDEHGSGSDIAGGRCPDSVHRVSKYRTIVADPPWHYDGTSVNPRRRQGKYHVFRELPYPTMTLDEIEALPVKSMAEDDAHLYLWTTQRYLEAAHDVARAWGFRPSCVLTWCKTPYGWMPGGTFYPTTEFIIFARRGALPALQRCDRQWFTWPRGEHSRKPDAFLDTVERVSPAPRIELFARRQRLGWDTWGNEALEHVDLGGHIQDVDGPQTVSGSQSG